MAGAWSYSKIALRTFIVPLALCVQLHATLPKVILVKLVLVIPQGLSLLQLYVSQGSTSVMDSVMIARLDLFVRIIPAWSILFTWIPRVATSVHQAIIVQEALLLQSNVLKVHLGKTRKLLNYQIVSSAQLMHSIILKVKFRVSNAEEERTATLIMVSRTVSVSVNTDNGALQIISAYARLASSSLLFLQLRVVYQLTYKIANLLSLNNVFRGHILMQIPNHAWVTAFAKTQHSATVRVQTKDFTMKLLRNVSAGTLVALKMIFVMPTVEINL